MRRGRRRDDHGSLTVELVLMTPALLILALALVAFGRVSAARQQVAEAAKAGADAASVRSDPSGATSAAAFDAMAELNGAGRTCVHPEIVTDVSRFNPGGSVTVTVRCQVALSDLSVPGMPGTSTISASSTAPIDPYRSVG
jgi:Flp pilus assembly protein TadG